MYRKKYKVRASAFGSELPFFPKGKKVGLAFSDFVTKEHNSFSGGKKSYGSFYKRSGILSLFPLFLLILIFIILVIRLFYVGVVQGAYYSRLSDENRTRTVIIPAPRGIIFDTKDRPLVRNVPVFEVIENGKVRIIEKEEALSLISQEKDVRASIAREYLHKEAASHVLGYTGQISEDELNHPDFAGYVLSDFVGKMGLEENYETLLHGKNGRELYEVDAAGKRIRFLGSEDPIPGKNIETTIDIDIQKEAQEAFKKVPKGAAVVTDPRNGAVLAMYSKPSFDSNLFTHAKGYKAVGEFQSVESLLTDSENLPLLNRAISGVYPPASTYKLITSAAGLETRSINEDTQFQDTGVVEIGGIKFGTWNFLQNGKTEGSLDIVKALKRSNDIFFYKASEKIGIKNLDEFSKNFGLGEVTGIDIPGEVPGTVPGESWKKRVIGEDWYLGDTYNMSIGQGYLESTPLQVNLMTQIVANNGTMYQPHMLKGREKIIKEDIAQGEHLAVIREGMRQACETGGTAYPLFNFTVANENLKIDDVNYFESSTPSARLTATSSAKPKAGTKYTKVLIGCKTGTAESHGVGKPDPHAWLTLFAPYHDPEIVVTVLVENGGEGSQVAAPIARDILIKYFESK